MRYLLILLLLIPFDILAQTTQRQAREDRPKTDPTSLAIRLDALSAADEVIDQIYEVEDLRSRVALAERIVLLLAKSRPERLRKMLTTMFDEIMTLKTEPPTTKSAPADVDSILRRIIQSAALIDVELARSYIETMASLKASDGTAKSASNASISYLRIATELSRNNPSLAVELATRSLANGVLPDTLLFLASLRKVNLSAANGFFIAALQSCQTRGAKDINELLLLYSYVFSPLRVPTVVSQGLGTLNIPGYSEVVKNYDVDPGLARQYLSVMTEILLNPLRYSAGNIETLALGVAGDFFALTILEPWVTTYDPMKASALSVQRNTVMSYMQAGQRDAAFSAADRWKTSSKDLDYASPPKEPTVEYLVNKAESAPDSKRKDQLYFRAALLAVSHKKHEYALSLVERISTDYSDSAKQFIRFDIALQDVQNQQFSEADKLARMDNVLVRRAFIFTVIADNLTQQQQKDPSRALQYLDEIQQLAGKLSDDKERLSVLIGVGNVYARLDTVRASETLQQIIKQANKVPDFVGNSSISNVLEIGGFYFDYSIYSNGLTMFDLIKRLTPISYYATLQDIRSLKNRTLRLQAIMALCTAVILEENHTARTFRLKTSLGIISKSPSSVGERRPDYSSAARGALLNSHQLHMPPKLLSLSQLPKGNQY